MRFQQLPSDDLVERVLAGQQSGEGLDDVAAAMATLRHLHADRGFLMGAELSGLLVSGLANDQGDLPATAANNAHGPAPQEAGPPNWTQRRKRMLHVLLGTLVGKVATATVAAATVVGGLGAADALPDPVQGAVADAAEVVHLDLPSPHDDEEDGDIVGAHDDEAEADELEDADDAADDGVAGGHDESDDDSDDDETDDDDSDDDETDDDDSDDDSDDDDSDDDSDDDDETDDDSDDDSDDDADAVRSVPSSIVPAPTVVPAPSADHDEDEADHRDDGSGSSSSDSSGSASSGTDHDAEDQRDGESDD